ncbi:hypothetical protein DV735_g2137, partial [Chaetothyriales sp. CBS 134920]
MFLDEDTLRDVARDGEMDYAKWPGIIDALLERLNHIVFNEFAMPRPFASLSQPPQIETTTTTSTATATATAPSHPPSPSPLPTTPLRSLPPVPLFTDHASNTTTTTHIPESVPPSQDVNLGTPISPLDALPSTLAQLLQSITTTIRASFSHRPPHTIQRLAELVLEPRKHYKTLPAWLRAVDRVVNVSSSADIFPLCDGQHVANGVINGETGGGILWKNDETRNGNYNPLIGGELGSDESLGGALLTPIPWLRHDRSSSMEGDADAEPDADVPEHGHSSHDLDLELDGEGGSRTNDAGIMHESQDPSASNASYHAAHQREFIQMEHGGRGAGLLPLHEIEGEQVHAHADDGSDEEEPHARGPQVVGAVDIGKVDGKEVELSITDPLDNDDAALTGGTTTGQERKSGATAAADEFEFVQRTGIDPMDVDHDGAAAAEEEEEDDEDNDEDDEDASSKRRLGQKSSSTKKQQQQRKKAKTRSNHPNDDMALVSVDGSRRSEKTIDEDAPANSTNTSDALR